MIIFNVCGSGSAIQAPSIAFAAEMSSTSASDFLASGQPSGSNGTVNSADSATGTAAVPTLSVLVPPTVQQWGPLIVKYATAYRVDPNLIASIMVSESNGDPNATSSMGAVGLMQVMNGSYDPETNIQQGTAIIADDLLRFGSLEPAVAAYNAGPSAVVYYGGVPPYVETETYVFRVLNRYYLYSQS